MLIDVHSHYYRPEHFSDGFKQQFRRARPGVEINLTITWDDYDATSSGCDRTVVFGGKAKLSGIWVPDHEIAAYVTAHVDRLIGFLSIDPTQARWQDELEEGHQNLKLKGIKLLPMYAGFNPDSREVDYLWEYASTNGLPVLLHTGTTFISCAPLEHTLPRLIDNVAIRFPEVKIVMAHLGHPYEGECIATIRKHPNVYADCSALYYRPFQLYQSLMLLQEYGVWNKLLFGTDYPVTTVSSTLHGIRGLNNMLEGTALPRLDMDQMEQMLARDTISLLGLS